LKQCSKQDHDGELLKRGSDLEQLVMLGAELFDRGFGEFKEILFALAPMIEADDDARLAFCCALVDVGALAGLEMAARMLGKAGDEWEVQPFYEHACRSLEDGQKVRDHLEEKARKDCAIGLFFQMVKIEMADNSETVVPPRAADWTLDEAISAVESEIEPRRSRLSGFGKRATEADIACIVQRLERETDAVRLRRYLDMFVWRALPVVPSNVAALLFGGDKELHRSALNALENVRSSQVRQMALEAIQGETEDCIHTGIRLLRSNYEPGDRAMLTAALEKMQDLDNLHSACIPVLDMANKNDDVLLADVFRWMYEFNPCASCRGSAVEKLVVWGEAPEQLLYEAQWDADQEIRNLARGVGNDSL
jgi:hypothetical protein